MFVWLVHLVCCNYYFAFLGLLISLFLGRLVGMLVYYGILLVDYDFTLFV